jgi:hypothetical protein
MRRTAFEEKEVPDNSVFWSVVGIVSVFVVVLAAVILVRSGATGGIVYQWQDPYKPYQSNPLACLDVPPCQSDTSFLCCSETDDQFGRKCIAPIGGTLSVKPQCPDYKPYMCTCVEKYPYRQTWPVPTKPVARPYGG